jgi:hypothetical protein
MSKMKNYGNLSFRCLNILIDFFFHTHCYILGMKKKCDIILILFLLGIFENKKLLLFLI